MYDNEYVGRNDGTGNKDQWIVAVQPDAFITGDTRAPYIEDITVVRVTENPFYHYKKGQTVELNLRFSEPVTIKTVDEFYIKLDGVDIW